MKALNEGTSTDDFEPGEYMTRRLVRAWQLKMPSTYLVPGATRHRLQREGTWVLEDLKARPRSKPKRGDAGNADSEASAESNKKDADSQPASAAHRHVRWAVDAELFTKKYRRLKRDVYLNVENIRLDRVEEHGAKHKKYLVKKDDHLYLHSREGLQRIYSEQHVVAIGKSSNSDNTPDIWPIEVKRVESKEYRKSTLYNRFILSLNPWRLRYMALRLFGMVLFVFASIGTIAGAIAVADSDSVLPNITSSTAARFLTLLLLLLPSVGRGALALAFPKSKPPTPLSLLMMTAGSVIAFSILIGLRIGNGPIHSLHTAMRQLTGGSYDQTLTGLVESLAQSIAFLGTLIVTSSFIMIGRLVFRQAWDLAVTRILTFDLIVVGLGTSTMRLLEDIRESRALQDIIKRIVIVDNFRGNFNTAAARGLGAHVIFGELDERLLRRLATSPVRSRWGIRYRWKTKFVLAYTTDEVTNLRVAELVDQLRDPESKPRVNLDSHVVVSVRAQDLWTQERCLKHPMTETDTKTQLAVINSFDTCVSDAIEILKMRQGGMELPVDLTGPIVLVGYSQLAMAFIRRLRQESLMVRKLKHQYGLKPSLNWEDVHWVTQSGVVCFAHALLPSDIDWIEDGERSVSEFGVMIHDQQSVSVRQLIASLDPAVVLFFGPNAVRDWAGWSYAHDCGNLEGSTMIYVECSSSERYQFDRGHVHYVRGPGQTYSDSASSVIGGPRSLVSDDGLVKPGYHLYGHVGTIAEITHAFYSAEYEQQQWRSEFLSPIHRKSSFDFVQLVLEELDKKGFVLQRASEEMTKICDETWEAVARAEHERWYKERIQREPNREDVKPWDKADSKHRRRTRESVKLVHEVLFMIGLDFAKRHVRGSVADLVRHGLLAAGARIIYQRAGETHRATVFASGDIQLSDGRTFNNPSAASVAVGGSRDGWQAWRTEDGQTLYELRSQLQK